MALKYDLISEMYDRESKMVVSTPENWEAFLLEQPVCLEKGIWHQVLALTEEASVKITENLDVESVFYKMEVPVKVAVTEI